MNLLRQCVLWGLFWGVSGAVWLAAPAVSFAQLSERSADREAGYIRPAAACPNEIEELTALLLRDLPGYANRVAQRSFRASLGATLNQDRVGEGLAPLPDDRPGYVVLAGRPEFEPLSLGPGIYAPTEREEEEPYQIFFTTLDRQYLNDRPVNLQHYHWLFLAQSESGWWFVSLFSRIGNLPADEPPTPPQDASQGVIAQAIRLWLRDCRSGDVVPLHLLP